MNKNIQHIIIIIFISTINFTFKNSEINGNLEVIIKGFKSNNGHALVNVFNSSKGFPDDSKKAFKSLTLTIKNKTCSFNLKAIPPGDYAITLIHDTNNNKKLDKNLIGIPVEDFGTSNYSSFKKPDFNTAKVSVKNGEQKSILIRMQRLF